MSIQLRSRHVAPSALTSKRPGTNELWFGAKNHQINAGSQKELLVQLANLQQAVASGQVSLSNPDQSQAELAAVKADKRAHLMSAYRDRSVGSTTWAETGAVIGAEVSQYALRDGFMRRFMLKADIPAGIVRVRLKTPNVTAIVASGPSQMWPQLVHGYYILPPEFYIKANVRIEERDIFQGSDDLLDDAFALCQEQIMVEEDRIYKQGLDATIGIANSQQMLVGGLTPAGIAALRGAVLNWGLAPQNILMASDVWGDIVGNAAEWGNLFDPVTQFEIIQTGFIGTLLGLGITTDAFRVVTQQVLNPGEIYCLSDPSTHGVYTDRGPVAAIPKDQYEDGVPARGWMFWELMSITVANARSVVKGIRS